MQRQYVALISLAAASALAACGGGGGNSGPTSRSGTFYVRSSGDDANSGLSPDQALRTISSAVSLATDGDLIIVGPGQYLGMVEIVGRGGSGDDNRIILVADPSGTMTGDTQEGDVTVKPGEGEVAAFQLTRAPFITIDGFTITGARDEDHGAAVMIRGNSNSAIVRNCRISGNRDGVRIEDSSDVRIFNNLIVENTNCGVLLAATSTGRGSQHVRLINNTVARNGDIGISIGESAVASTDAFLRNNVVQDNENRQIDVAGATPGSVGGCNAGFNLVFPNRDGSRTPHGENDVSEDARFVDEARGDYHLDQRDSPAVDVGDPATDAGLRDVLEKRSTATDGSLDDDGRLDLGYHFPG